MDDERLGPYRLISELGSGGTSTVWLAEVEEPGPGRTVGDRVAVKVIHPHLLANTEFLPRILKEVEIGMSLHHENIVRTLDFGAAAHRGRQVRYLVMEYVEGETLREMLKELGWFPEGLCRHVGREIALALSAMHSAGIIHRDLKPENVLITRDEVVKVMDLGFARIADEAIRLSATGQFVGTMSYASPEQFGGGGGDVDGRADLYALGLVLYELMTGRHPFFDEDPRVVIQRQLSAEPRPPSARNSQVSPFLEELILTLLKKERDQRAESAAEVLEALEHGEDSDWWHRRSGARRAGRERVPPRIPIPRDTALHGRERELEILDADWEAAGKGEGRVVLLEGEAGIGKTRLIDEFAARLQRRGEEMDFLYGAFPPGGAATAAGAFSSAFRRHLGEEDLEESLAEHLPVGRSLIPAFAAFLRGHPAPETGETLDKQSIQTLFVNVARSLAGKRPTLIVIDDLHFAPEEGLGLFAALAHALPGHRILLVGASRPAPAESWSLHLDHLAHVRRLGLGRLGPRDLQRLLGEALASDRLARELGPRVAVKSDGNPFFTFEILRSLEERGQISRRDDGSFLATGEIREIGIPPSLEGLVKARVSVLEPKDRDILDIAACCGIEFDPLLVAEALERGRIPVLKRLGQIERAHRLVRSSGRNYVFDHHQVQEAVYESLSELLREEYHAVLGMALERRTGAAEADPAHLAPGVALALCRHLFRGGRPDRALRYLDAACDDLEAGHLNSALVELARQALSAPGLLAGERRARLLERLARRLGLLGRREEQGEALEEALGIAEAAGDLPLRISILQHLGSQRRATGRLEEALRLNEAALTLAREAGGVPAEGSARCNVGNLLSDLSRYEEAREQYAKALALARAREDRAGEARAVANLAMMSWELGDNDRAREQFRYCLPIFRDLGDRQHEGQATGMLGLVHLYARRPREAREHFERHLAISREIGDRQGEQMAVGNLGMVLTYLGKWKEALDHLEQDLEMAREIGNPLQEAMALNLLGSLRLDLGDLEGARRDAGRALTLARSVSSRRETARALHLHASLEEEEGREDGAEAAWREALDACRGAGAEADRAETLFRLGLLHRRMGHEEEGRKELQNAAAAAAEAGDDTTRLMVRLALARTGGGEVAAIRTEVEEAGGSLFVGERILARYLLWLLEGEIDDLAKARRLLQDLGREAPAGYRESLRENVRLHREIVKAWDRSQGDLA